MKELGGKFQKAENFKPFVVTDGKLITGQNPTSLYVAAQKVIEILEKIKMISCIKHNRLNLL